MLMDNMSDIRLPNLQNLDHFEQWFKLSKISIKDWELGAILEKRVKVPVLQAIF
jgi:hypothetical protein